MLAAAAGLSVGLQTQALPGGAATPQDLSNPRAIFIGDDWYYNYDFGSAAYNRNNADWAINMLFINQAEVDRVKDMYWGTTYDNSRMYNYVSDGNNGGPYSGKTGSGWDQDAGTKDPDYINCLDPDMDFKHMRLYADSPSAGDDHLYNTSYGFYVIGSTHWDINECQKYLGGYTVSGWSENAEGVMAERARQNGASSVYEDEIWLQNYESPRYDSGDQHFWDNDGWATLVFVPSHSHPHDGYYAGSPTPTNTFTPTVHMPFNTPTRTPTRTPTPTGGGGGGGGGK
jgi:hypothetical protein